MKKILRIIVASTLALIARAVVRRYRPSIVMVTGSVGKTSTKDAVAAVLSARFFVRKSDKNFNSEFGVPFTILGVQSPWGNPFAWFSVAKSALALLTLPNHYPNMLVLEVGADRPGDLARIACMATPDVVVVTRLPEIPVHVEAYASPDAVREEEFSPAYALPAAAPLIVLADDLYALDMAMRTSARIISYGCADSATARVCDAGFYEVEGGVAGMRANVNVEGEEGSLIVKGSVGMTQLLPAAAALAAARAFLIPLPEALHALESYDPPPGRGRLLAGKNGSVIIDDSYNASPAATEEALATLKAFPHAKRRIAVLGDMLELGRYSVMEHERIGALVRASADVLVAVGIRARAFATSAGNMEVMVFDTAAAAAAALSDLVRAGDVILVKGSQSIRTERIVEALLANPADVARLVRQEKAWKRKA
ncbi:MAG: UDP-N-acetylmuramoyl-tripeptide--D-alanyl-D-alanine ligase [Candidatus Kaiserbacteria bacterium]|nr:UDP-N-acetylmuramoyl-tripeptide--D-alanyl-D-alanine ligase [Candidatus Kaiserbacteria bacterium]